MSTFAYNLKRLRMQFGLTQARVAEFLAISVRAYQNYENGSREPNLDTLKSLANFFNVSIDYLVGNNACESDLEFRYSLLKTNEKLLVDQMIDSLIKKD